MQVSKYQLTQAMPQITSARVDVAIGPLNEAMEEFEIDTPLRQAAFLAQIAHESGELRWVREIWGPTPAQKRYEGRKDLGNTQPGDGRKYLGRGPIQITGRANYVKYGKLLGIPLEDQPVLAESFQEGFRIAACFWKTHGLNEKADAGDFRGITKAINGGYNGLADRLKYYGWAKTALKV
jgi:putative chitinase